MRCHRRRNNSRTSWRFDFVRKVIGKTFRTPLFPRPSFKHDKGSIAIVMALTLTVFGGAVGLGVDVAYWYNGQLKIQTAADAAARAAIWTKINGGDEQTIRQNALNQAAVVGFDISKGAMTVYAPPRNPEYSTTGGVEIVIEQAYSRLFSRLFLEEDLNLIASSIAIPESDHSACVIALNPDMAGSISVSGSAQLTLVGCEAATNSVDSNAFDVDGSGAIIADCVASAGAISSTAGMYLDCPSVREYANQIEDPFAHLPEPDTSGLCLPYLNVPSGALPTPVLPGRYCNGMKINSGATAALAPGIYVIDGGTLTINGGAHLIGSEVMFFLTNGAELKFTGGAELDISAPSIGAFAGVLFYADRDDVGTSHQINGNADSELSGALYFPSQILEYAGGEETTNTCAVLIADQLVINGNARVYTSCAGSTQPGLSELVEVTIVE